MSSFEVLSVAWSSQLVALAVDLGAAFTGATLASGGGERVERRVGGPLEQVAGSVPNDTARMTPLSNPTLD